MDALRLEQQFDGFKDVRLIVGDENPDSFVLARVSHLFSGLALWMACLHNSGFRVGNGD